MMRSLFAAVSGLRNHQVRMDVVGNNIANVNTVGFKSSRVTFQELFNQTLSGATASTAARGGINPMQVGLGSAMGSIDVIHSQGSLQVTGRLTDLGLQGAGMFILQQEDGSVYTRVGSFDVDARGYLVHTGGGLRVMGWQAEGGQFGTKDIQYLESIRVPLGQDIPASATAGIGFAGNLNSTAEVGDTHPTAVEVFDSQGARHLLEFEFEKTGDNTWAYTVSWDGDEISDGELVFDTDGILDDGASNIPDITFTPDGVDEVEVAVDFSDLVQMAGTSSAAVRDRDGHTQGTLNDFTIDDSGTITGVYSNGLTRNLAQVALAMFPNPAGLLKTGDNLYQESNNSGLISVGEAGTGGRGQMMPGTLEMSNVDLAREFTDMIVTQRGFQANSRIISVTDEMLNELVNMKR